VQRPHRRFRFIREIAEGSFGKVYLAEMLTGDDFSAVFAIKLLHARWAQNEEIVSRARDEARLLGRLRHRNIVRVEDLTSIDGRCAVIMEYLEGVDLKSMVRYLKKSRKRFPIKSVFETMVFVAGALEAAFNHVPLQGGEPLRLIHRDIKPSNVMITPSAEVKLLDFGIARANFETREAETRNLAFGSPAYMAPERALGDPDSPRSDVYSLGATLYELLAGKMFGRARLRPGQFEHQIEEKLAVIRLPDPIRPQAMELLRSMLAWDPANRPGASGVTEACENLAEIADDSNLRRFCRAFVPKAVVAGQKPPSVDDPLQGMTIFEDRSLLSGGADGGGGEVALPPPPSRPPRPTIPAPQGLPAPQAAPVNPRSAPTMALDRGDERSPPARVGPRGGGAGRPAPRRPVPRRPAPRPAEGGHSSPTLARSSGGQAARADEERSVLDAVLGPDHSSRGSGTQMRALRLNVEEAPEPEPLSRGQSAAVWVGISAVAAVGLLLLGSAMSRGVTLNLSGPPQVGKILVSVEGRTVEAAGGAVDLGDLPAGDADLTIQAGFFERGDTCTRCCWTQQRTIPIARGLGAYEFDLNLGSPTQVCPTQERGYRMLALAPGAFEMGSPRTEEKRSVDETRHSVELTRPFLMGATEVTQALYEAVMGANPSTQESDIPGELVAPDLPVQNVNWFDAVAFANSLSEIEGLEPAYTLSGREVTWDVNASGYRLPTEAEWEYAARAGGDAVFGAVASPTGVCDFANVADRAAGRENIKLSTFGCQDGYPALAPVGSYPDNANAFGLMDTTGNVAEWVWDFYRAFGDDPLTDPRGPERGKHRAQRGSSYHSGPAYARVAARVRARPQERSAYVGIRLARNGGSD